MIRLPTPPPTITTEYVRQLLRSLETAFLSKADKQGGTIFVGEDQKLVFVNTETGETIEVPEGFALADHDHAGVYSPVGHNHDGRYARLSTSNNFTQMPNVSGAPIVERGSNANGEWVKWADGTQQCVAFNTPQLSANVSDGSIWRSTGINVDFPVSFVSPPRVITDVYDVTGHITWGATDSVTSTTQALNRYVISVANSGKARIVCMAFGAWK